jgi:hypothetical protein
VEYKLFITVGLIISIRAVLGKAVPASVRPAGLLSGQEG